MVGGVCMALHTAEVSERDGMYSGVEVNQADRLLSLDYGGQVLVSDATEALLRTRVVGKGICHVPTHVQLRSSGHVFHCGSVPTEPTSSCGGPEALQDTAAE